VTCVRVEDRTCWLRIEPEQALTLPYSGAFALALLVEAVTNIVYERSGVPWKRPIQGPLVEALEREVDGDINQALEALCEGIPHADAAALAARYVTCRGYRDVVGFTVPHAMQATDGIHTGARWWSSEAERLAARRRISSELEAWQAARSDHVHRKKPAPAVRPAVTIVIEATQQEWVTHMAPGMLWDSYVFDDVSTQFP
jgi:hypothetical protein